MDRSGAIHAVVRPARHDHHPLRDGPARGRALGGRGGGPGHAARRVRHVSRDRSAAPSGLHLGVARDRPARHAARARDDRRARLQAARRALRAPVDTEPLPRPDRRRQSALGLDPVVRETGRPAQEEDMTAPRVVSHEEWLAARKAFLAKEKAFTHQREELASERRALPWERVEKAYLFEGPEGRLTFAGLFAGCGQLIVQHFMYGPDWDEGCPSCSFWADNFNGIDVLLAARDTSFVVVARGALAKLEAYKKRMGWTFRWVSSAGGDFSFDYGASFKPDEEGLKYNFETLKPYGEETP